MMESQTVSQEKMNLTVVFVFIGMTIDFHFSILLIQPCISNCPDHQVYKNR